jgi:hypothetical protein
MGVNEDISWADAIVIGAGPSGLMSSRTAQEAGLNVLLIDSGLTQTDIFSSRLEKNSSKYKSGGLGGASINWGAQCVLPSNYDFEKWLMATGANNEYLKLVYDSIATTSTFLNLPINLDGRYFGNEIELYSDKATTRHSIYLKDGQLNNYFKTVISELRFIDNFQISNLEIRDGLVVGIYHSDNFYSVSSKKLILACGTLATTYLINNSIYGGETNTFPLQDHPHGYVASFMGSHPKGLRKAQIHKSKGFLFKRKFEYHSTSQKRSGIFEFHYDLIGNGLRASGFEKPLKMFNKILSFINRLTFKYSRRVFFNVPLIHIWVQIEQEKGKYLNFDNGVISSSWGLSETDREFIKELQQHVIGVCQEMGLDLMWKPSFENMEFINSHFVDAFHPSGTLTMNKNPSLGLVDEFGVVHGVSNLLINSAAVWPISGWFNPTFLQMAIADLNTKRFSKL